MPCCRGLRTMRVITSKRCPPRGDEGRRAGRESPIMRTRAGACASTMGAPFIRRRRAAMPRFPILARLLRRIAPARHRPGAHQTLQALAAECGPLAVSTLEHALAEPCQHSVAQALVAVRTF